MNKNIKAGQSSNGRQTAKLRELDFGKKKSFLVKAIYECTSRYWDIHHTGTFYSAGAEKVLCVEFCERYASR